MDLPGFFAEASLNRTRKNYKEMKITLKHIKSVEVESAASCIYGNWCGPGCGSGSTKDDVDECCKAHDKCYESRGYLACSCDKELLKCVRSKINPLTSKGRAAAAVYGWFSQGICNPFN